MAARPLVMLQVPEMMQQVAMMKLDRERREKAEQLRGLPMEEIIKEQNMPRPVEHWVEVEPFLEEQAGESEPRRSRWRKDKDKKDDDEEPMVRQDMRDIEENTARSRKF